MTGDVGAVRRGGVQRRAAARASPRSSTKVTAAAAALTVRKRCFETAQVPLRLPEQPGPRVSVRATLRKVPGCR